MRERSRKQSSQNQIGVKQTISSILSLCSGGPGTCPGTSELLWSVRKKQFCLSTEKVTPASTHMGSGCVSGPWSLPGATDPFLPLLKTLVTYEQSHKDLFFSPCGQASVLSDTT